MARGGFGAMGWHEHEQLNETGSENAEENGRSSGGFGRKDS